jgi:hypothetical protein
MTNESGDGLISKVVGRIRSTFARSQPAGTGNPSEKEVASDKETPRLLNYSFGRNAEFFSENPIADLQTALGVVYDGPALEELKLQVANLNLQKESNVHFDYLGKSDPDSDLKLGLSTRPLDDKSFLISIDEVFGGGLALKERLAEALEKHPVVSHLWMQLGFPTIEGVNQFLAKHKIDFAAGFKASVYKQIARDYFAEFQKTRPSSDETVVKLRDELLHEKDDQTQQIDRKWLDATLLQMEKVAPDHFRSHAFFVAKIQTNNPDILAEVRSSHNFEWNGATDEVAIKLDPPEKNFTVDITCQPQVLSNDPRYQQEVIDTAKSITGQPQLQIKYLPL